MSNKRTFSDLSNEELLKILNIALDGGGCKTIKAGDIERYKQDTQGILFGTCKMLNRDMKKIFFRVDENTVHAWMEIEQENMPPDLVFAPIYNLNDIVSTIKSLLHG